MINLNTAAGPCATQRVAAGPCATQRVEALIEITQSLNLIFKEENAALAERRPEGMASLQAKKARLASTYAQSIQAMSTDRGGMRAVDQALLSRLREITTAFEAQAARQRALLDGKPSGAAEPDVDEAPPTQPAPHAPEASAPADGNRARRSRMLAKPF